MSNQPPINQNAITNSAIIPKQKTIRQLGILLLILIIGTPLGLLAIGTAFGEWGSDELFKELGYVPSGVEEGENLWHAPIFDYEITNLDPVVGYILSAIIGILISIGIIFIFGKILKK